MNVPFGKKLLPPPQLRRRATPAPRAYETFRDHYL